MDRYIIYDVFGWFPPCFGETEKLKMSKSLPQYRKPTISGTNTSNMNLGQNNIPNIISPKRTVTINHVSNTRLRFTVTKG